MDTIYSFRSELKTLGYSKGVINNYPRYAQKLLEFAQEIPQKIQPIHIRKYYEYLQTKHHRFKAELISPAHIHGQLLAIKIYFEYLERNRIIKQNPYILKLKQPLKNTRKPFTQEQIQELYKNCRNTEEKIILHLCYGCGLRNNEAVSLQINDFNFNKKLLYIRHGKGKKRRVIPLTETLANDLKSYCEQTIFYRKPNQENFLITQNSISYNNKRIYKDFKKLLKRTKSIIYADYCLHSLRHSIATHLLENEMSIEMVRDFLGHSQLVTTQNYTKINFKKTILYL